MMTNSEAKQAAIIKAWGEYWERLHPKDKDSILMDEGMLRTGKTVDPIYEEIEVDPTFDQNLRIRNEPLRWIAPKSIFKQIEDNNGWTRIEPDGSNLPGEVKLVTDQHGKVVFAKELPKGTPGIYEWCEDGVPQAGSFMAAFQLQARFKRNQMGSPVGKLTHFRKYEPRKPPVY